MALKETYNTILSHFSHTTPTPTDINITKLNQYGRPENKTYIETFLQNSELPLNIFYLQTSSNTPTENSNIFSFDPTQFQTFTQNLTNLKNTLPQINFENSYMITKLIQNFATNQFNLTSRIYSNSYLDSHIITTLNYLTAITQNPEYILKNKSFQKEFTKSVQKLKSQSISLEDLFNLNETFNFQTSLPDFSIINNNTLFHIQSQNSETNHPIDINIFSSKYKLLKKENSKLQNEELINYLKFLNLEIDPTKLKTMKTQKKEIIQQSSPQPKKKSLKSLKQSINQILTSEETQELFALNQSSKIQEIVTKLTPEQLKKYFPFKNSKITNIDHIKEFLFN